MNIDYVLMNDCFIAFDWNGRLFVIIVALGVIGWLEDGLFFHH